MSREATREAHLGRLVAAWGVASGQRWSLTGAAEHVVDCRDARDVERPESARTLVFDPPWDDVPALDLGAWSSRLVFTDGRRLGETVTRHGSDVAWQFVWDCQCALARNNRPFQRYKCCLWYGDLGAYRWRGARLDPVPDRPQGKKLGDLYACSLPTLHGAGYHPHEKPLAWVRCLIGNCADGDVFDPFLGSGTTLLACDATGRRCYGVERDPRYVALAIDRAAQAGLAVRRLS